MDMDNMVGPLRAACWPCGAGNPLGQGEVCRGGSGVCATPLLRLH